MICFHSLPPRAARVARLISSTAATVNAARPVALLRHSSRQKIINRKAVIASRQQQDKKQERESRDDVRVKLVERLFQKVAEGDDREDEAECDEGLARAKAEDDQSPCDEFDEWNDDAHGPQRPDGQEGVCVGK